MFVAWPLGKLEFVWQFSPHHVVITGHNSNWVFVFKHRQKSCVQEIDGRFSCGDAQVNVPQNVITVDFIFCLPSRGKIHPNTRRAYSVRVWNSVLKTWYSVLGRFLTTRYISSYCVHCILFSVYFCADTHTSNGVLRKSILKNGAIFQLTCFSYGGFQCLQSHSISNEDIYFVVFRMDIQTLGTNYKCVNL